MLRTSRIRWSNLVPGIITFVAAITWITGMAFHTPASAKTTSQPAQMFAQVTSVSEIKDVQPSDNYYQAVQTLVEKYGCAPTYPDNTFRGNQQATRGEVAQMLSGCLDRLAELIQQ